MIARIVGLVLLAFAPAVLGAPAAYKVTLPATPRYKLLSSEGNLLAIVDDKRTIHLVALPLGHELRTLDGHNVVNGALSADGRWLAVGTKDKHVIVYSTSSKARKTWDTKSRPQTEGDRVSSRIVTFTRIG